MGKTDEKTPSKPIAPKTADPSKDNVDDLITSIQLGIWQVLTLKSSPFNPKQWRDDLVTGSGQFYRLLCDMYRLSPGMLILFMLSKTWGGIEAAVLMHLSSRLLQIIEVGLVRGEADAHAIYMAIISRLSCVVLVAILRWWCDTILPGFKTQVIHHYEVMLMRARLKTDLTTSQEPHNKSRVSSEDGWNAFESIVEFGAELLKSASQIMLIVHSSRNSGGPLFALICIAKPLLHAFSSRNIWSQTCVINSNDARYNRMQALESLSGNHYKQDYISGNLGGHILTEYEKASNELGETCTDQAWEQMERRSLPYFDVISEVLGDLPMVYCAINAIMNPSKYSIASIAVLQQSSLTLRYSIHHILYTTKSFRRQMSKLKNLHMVSAVKNKLQDGDLPYPKADGKSEAGMAFELRNINFSYPGSKKKTNALNDVSLSIKPGALVVIVGANGSGKSTIIKLLTRLYDATSGQILVDGTPVQNYRGVELRQAMASFTQDHNLFPLSLYENIALGYPECSSNAEMVSKAADNGGASAFIAKLTDGFQTILDPQNVSYHVNVPSDPDHPLLKKMEALEKKIDVSGGERQRVVASRTFMQLNSGRVKFVAVDEPSSALDPEGEFQLFDRLIAGRAGKTMVFVTHRFGHLTKYADTIICMKDGAIAQSGTHEELLTVGGEYAKLYKIQADAFSSGGDPYKTMNDA